LERKAEIITSLQHKYRFKVSEVIDLSYFEQENKFLEGTGSMILDRENKIAYACLSTRTNTEVLSLFCKLFNYTPIYFNAFDQNKVPVYHTNVLMALGKNIAIVCLESIYDKIHRKNLTDSLNANGKTIIDITFDQMVKFAGNMIQLKTSSGNLLLVMSKQGYESLSNEQISKIEKLTGIFYSDISHIEKYGGGSARCMIAEIFNPKETV
jgi:hypothetical protein